MTAPNPAVAQGGASVANAAIKYALAQVGKPYVWGGTGPNGYDCSGLTYMAYLSAGLDITRTTHTQIAQGTPLPRDMPVNSRPPGVLIFPDSGHVYMALGGGQIVEAATTGIPVHVRNDYTPVAYAIRQVTGAGSVSSGTNAVAAGLVSDAAGAVGFTADGALHVADVMLNWAVYIGVIVFGAGLAAAGLFLLAEKQLTGVGRVARKLAPSQ